MKNALQILSHKSFTWKNAWLM
uniref:Uncharacterized protein n=1 Tax=Anguilla anguilla TaxID=7936 RepID=A0A0E9T6K1_ANGAN